MRDGALIGLALLIQLVCPTTASAVVLTSKWEERKIIKVESKIEQISLQYFFDSEPASLSNFVLPSFASHLFIARVKIVVPPFYLGPRHGQTPSAEFLGTRLRILNVMSGHAPETLRNSSADIDVKFGRPNRTFSLIPHPATIKQLAQDYFVVVYSDDQGGLHLAGASLTESQYRQWEHEFWEAK